MSASIVYGGWIEGGWQRGNWNGDGWSRSWRSSAWDDTVRSGSEWGGSAWGGSGWGGYEWTGSAWTGSEWAGGWSGSGGWWNQSGGVACADMREVGDGGSAIAAADASTAQAAPTPATAAVAPAAGMLPPRGASAPPPLQRRHLGSTTGLGPGAAEAALVSHALTVQGPQQGLAMVTGRKQIENRGWRIPCGWYALHVGSQPLAAIGAEWCARMRQAWPEAPAERSLPSSKIVGLIHILEQRTPAECPPKDHTQSIWAVGPICHIIDKAIQLKSPIQHRGDKGLWEIEAAARQRLLRQLPELPEQRYDALPRALEPMARGAARPDSPQLHA